MFLKTDRIELLPVKYHQNLNIIYKPSQKLWTIKINEQT